MARHWYGRTTRLFLMLAALPLALAAGSAARAAEETTTFECESGNTVVLHVDTTDPAALSARLEYQGQVFDMFHVAAGPGQRFSTEQGLAPDRGLQWTSENGQGTLSEMVMDHTAGGPTAIETCTAVEAAPVAANERLTVTGEVFFLEMIMLPGDPKLTMTLVDRADGTVLGTAALEPARPPVSFKLSIDPPGEIGDREYALIAEIHAEGELWFRTAEPFPIDPTSTEPVSIRVVRATDPAPVDAAAAGEFPVGNWLATAINGTPTDPKVKTSITFDADGGVSGSGGCNRFGGQAEFEDSGLTVRNVFSTMMACFGPAGDQEQVFLVALEQTASHRLDGAELVLLDAAGAELVRFIPA